MILSWVITDLGTTFVTELRNGTLNHRTVAAPVPNTTTFTLTRPQLIGLVTGSRTSRLPWRTDQWSSTGTQLSWVAWFGLIAPVDTEFAIVTP